MEQKKSNVNSHKNRGANGQELIPKCKQMLIVMLMLSGDKFLKMNNKYVIHVYSGIFEIVQMCTQVSVVTCE